MPNTAALDDLTPTAYITEIGASLERDHTYEARLNPTDYNHALRIRDTDHTTAGHAVRDARANTWIAIIRTDDPTTNRVIGTRLDATTPELLPAITPGKWTQFHSARDAAAALLRLLAHETD